MKTYDFIVVGSGISGLSFALRAAAHGRVAMVTKRDAASTNTAWAQGGIACVQSEQDSFDRHVAGTLDAEAGLDATGKLSGDPDYRLHGEAMGDLTTGPAERHSNQIVAASGELVRRRLGH